jgi:hypothetical protein
MAVVPEELVVELEIREVLLFCVVTVVKTVVVVDTGVSEGDLLQFPLLEGPFDHDATVVYVIVPSDSIVVVVVVLIELVMVIFANGKASLVLAHVWSISA